jgi:hypothetical protein
MSDTFVERTHFKPATGGSSNAQGSPNNSAKDLDDLQSDEKSQYVFETVEMDDDDMALDLEDPHHQSSEVKL